MFDWKQLFSSDKIMKFWPNSEQTPKERVLSSMRFVLYSGCIIYLIKRDIRVLVLSLLVVGVLYTLYVNGAIKGHEKSITGNDTCQLPSKNNPLANFMLGEDPERPPACYYPTVKKQVQKNLDHTFSFDVGRSRTPHPVYQQRMAARQFVTTPDSTRPHAQTEFAEWCYGKKFSPMCKDDTRTCNPNARGVQLEAFGGLDISGNRRGGSSRN